MKDLSQNKNPQTTSLSKDLSSRRMDARKDLEGKTRREERETQEAILFAKKTEEVRLRTEEENKKIKEIEKQKEKDKLEQDELEKQRHERLQIIKDKAFEKKRSEDKRGAQKEAFFEQIKSTKKTPNSSTVYDIRKPPEVQINRDLPKATRIKTYKNDITKTIKKQNSSIVQIANEEKARSRKKSIESTNSSSQIKPRRNWKIIIILLVILGTSGVIAIYKINDISLPSLSKKDDIKSVNKANFVKSLVPADIEKKIQEQSASSDTMKLVTEALLLNSNIEDIKNIYITKDEFVVSNGKREEIEKTITAQELFSLWINFAPEKLSRSLDDDFMLGNYTFKITESSPFLILTTSSNSQTFAGMLDWENSIYDDLYGLFGLSAELEVSDAFYDGIVNGTDVRILENVDGEVAIIYSFVNKNTIILALEVETLAKLLQSLK